MAEKKIPILSELKSECCGCGVCAVICPVQAITMSEDSEGFLYPVINESKCITCMQCVNNCIIKKRRTDVRSK